MVCHFVGQVEQSKPAVRNCAATRGVNVLEYITDAHCVTRDRHRVKSAGVERFVLFTLAVFSLSDNCQLKPNKAMFSSWHIRISCIFKKKKFFFFNPDL